LKIASPFYYKRGKKSPRNLQSREKIFIRPVALTAALNRRFSDETKEGARLKAAVAAT